MFSMAMVNMFQLLMGPIRGNGLKVGLRDLGLLWILRGINMRVCIGRI